MDKILSDKRKEFLAYVAVAAIEGGIQYWAQVLKYQGMYSKSGDLVDVSGKICQHEDPNLVLEITAAVFQKGIEFIRAGNVKMSSKLRSCILRADKTGEADNIDAEAADVILQVGLFGEIIYG